MKKLIDWIKVNKLSSILILVILLFLVGSSSRAKRYTYESAGFIGGSPGIAMLDGVGTDDYAREPAFSKSVEFYEESAPETLIQNRKVVTNSSVSAVVKDVRQSTNQIITQAESLGGFMINSNINTPEEGGTAYLSVRVPSNSIPTFLEFIRGNAIKVVNENVSGRDVTDQYVDYEKRLATLRKTLSIFEGIMEDAKDVDEILRVQNRILQVQGQIESIQGQLQRLDSTTTTTLVSVELSTDEFALSYVPNNLWNPKNVFKEAVRSLVTNTQGMINYFIWGLVYLPVIAVVAVAARLIKKKINGRSIDGHDTNSTR